MAIFPLSTPTHNFYLQTDASVIEKIKITYVQNGKIVLTKETKDVTFNGNVCSVKLTQEETKNFEPNETVEIQVRILTAAGDSVPSEIIIVPCGRVLDNEVMT